MPGGEAGAHETEILGRGFWIMTARVDIRFAGGTRSMPVADATRDIEPQSDRVGMTNDDNGRARFAQVVLPHLSDGYTLARWIAGNRPDAEDILQEASLRAFRAIGDRRHGSARSWWLTIVRNTAYTWLRRNRPALLVGVADIEAVERTQPPADEALTPEASLIAQADAARLEAAIATLPAPFRETLILRDLQGLDYREIAEVTAVPIGTVMSRLARARTRLIAALEGTGR
jgi:RNA polymerase sigma-70 factor (ECF subfamily)